MADPPLVLPVAGWGRRPGWVADGLAAGAVAGVLSGVPSTLLALARGEPGLVLDAVRAAGALAGRASLRRGMLVHAVVSLGWGLVLAAAGSPPPILAARRPATGGLAGAWAGAVIAALDLEVIGRRIPAVADLPRLDQWLDHLAFGAVAGAVLARRRAPATGSRCH